jgi:hypothetical protein
MTLWKAENLIRVSLAVPYTVTWSNGSQQLIRQEVLTVNTAQLSIFDFLLLRLWTLLGIALVGFLLWKIVRRQVHPPLKGRMVFEYLGAQVAELDFVTDPIKQLHVLETPHTTRRDKAFLQIGTGNDRKSFTVRMQHCKQGWRPHLKAEGARVRVDSRSLNNQIIPQGKWAEVEGNDLRFIYYY